MSENTFQIGQEVSPGVVYCGLSDETGTEMFKIQADFGLVNYNQALSISYNIVGQDGLKGSMERLNPYRPDSPEGAACSEQGWVYKPQQDPSKDDEGLRMGTIKEILQISKTPELMAHFYETCTDTYERLNGTERSYCWTSEQTFDERKSHLGWGGHLIWNANCVDLKTGEVNPVHKGKEANLCLVFTKKRQPVG